MGRAQALSAALVAACGGGDRSAIDAGACAPDFATWTAHPAPIALAGDFAHPTFDRDRVIYDATGPSGKRVLFEQPLAGGGAATAIAALASATDDTIAPSLGPDGTLWFARAGAVWRATPSDAAPARVELPLSGSIEPSSPGFVHGETRLVVAVASVLHELASADRTYWLELPTALGGPAVDPYTSPDGCFVLFASDRAHTRDLYVAARGTDGVFGPAQLLAFASATDLDEFAPAMADPETLYFVSSAPGVPPTLMLATPQSR